MGCGASSARAGSYKHLLGAVAKARTTEEVRIQPLITRLERLVDLHKEGLLSNAEFEAFRAAIMAEIAGHPAAATVPTVPTAASRREARAIRADELRRQVGDLERQMKNSPDRLPDGYHALLAAMRPKFTTEVGEEEEWGGAGTGPLQDYYNRIAGTTIDDVLNDGTVPVDSHNNPLGTQYDLPRDGTMQEHTLVLCWFSAEGTYGMPVKALETKGFNVIVHEARRSSIPQMMVSILKADVVWVVSGASVTEAGFPLFVEAVDAFHRRGGGLFIWGDNAPHFAHANEVLASLFPQEGILLDGNDKGSNIMRAHDDGTAPGHLARSHLIMTGLRSLFEGVTISFLSRVGPLKVLATYNNGQGYAGKPYCAVADAEVYRRCRANYAIGRGRVVIDGGFTKLYDEYWCKTAGTERYVKNASTWLVNINSRIASEGTLPCASGPAADASEQPTRFRPPRTNSYRAGGMYAPHR